MNGQIQIQLPELGSREFWKLYDRICEREHIWQFVFNNFLELVSQMREIMRAAHLERVIHNINRPECRWERHHAWLALANANLLNTEGCPFVTIRCGDVVTVERNWDRDVLVTHSPANKFVSGYLLSGKWDNMVGLFMPLFTESTIRGCAEIRAMYNMIEAGKRVDESAKDRGWY